MTIQAHRDHDVQWFKNHGKDAGILGTTCERHSIKGHVFHLLDRVLGGTYKIIYGYYETGGKLKARMWYFSGSEAAWRSFTGYRENGAWMKGAEGVKGHIGSGYIFENIVYRELEDVLETFWGNGAPLASDEIFPWDRKNSDKTLQDYYHNAKGRTPAISKDYSAERKYVRLATPAVDPGISNALEKGSTTLQREYNSVHNGNKRVRTGIGHQIKHTNNIWDGWILPSLNNKPYGTIKRRHPVLNEPYTIERYTVQGLKNDEDYTFEIAYTDNQVQHTYASAFGIKDIKTNICWIRTVYLNKTDITSFGTHRNCPINLAFLPQKPCDYLSQTSGFYLAKVKVSGGKGIYSGKYIILSLFNEAVSPLVKKFKMNKKMPVFKNKYNMINKLNTVDGFNFVRPMIINGIEEYLGIHETKTIKGRDTKGHHGDSGLKRAKQLRDEINKSTTTEGINKILYSCFKNNSVGNFKGGMFSKIRTNPSSLFTCICRASMVLFIVPDSKTSRKLNLKGNNKTIQRMANKVETLDFDSSKLSETEFITAHASVLLSALTDS